MLKRLTLFAFATLLNLALLEGGARVWLQAIASDAQFSEYASPAQREARAVRRDEGAFRYAPHHYLGWVPAANYRRGENHHNQHGYRGAPFSLEKPAGEFRIVCLGGSTTYTSAVDASAQSYPAQLEAELQRRGFRSVRVINGGAEGYSSWETLLNFQFRALDLDPDLVIVYHGINDLMHRLVWPPGAYRGDNSGGLERERATAEPLHMRSTLLRILWIRAGWAASPSLVHRAYVDIPNTGYGFTLVRQLRSGSFPDAIFRVVKPQRMLRENPPTYFERNLEHLALLAREHGVQPLFATFALSMAKKDAGLSQPIFESGIAEMNRSLVALGARRGVPVFDFASAFPDDPSLLYDAIHTNAEGAKEKARLFADYLESSGLLDAARGPAAR